MKLKVEDIEPNGYVLTDSFNHNESLAFLNEKVNLKKSLLYYVYFFFLIIPTGVFSFILTKNLIIGETDILTSGLYVILGIIMVFAFIPLHELLHGLAYRLIGARKISFFLNHKKFYFATVADKFVVNLKEFRIVAILPFLFALLLVIALIPFTNEYWRLSLLSFFVIHNIFCSGDFALLNYMEVNKNQNIITYDDKNGKMTYFFKKLTNNSTPKSRKFTKFRTIVL